MVKLYTSKTCGQCPSIKKYLSLKGIKWQEIDRDTNNNHESLFNITGSITVPAVVTDKGYAVGLNYGKVAEIL